MKICMLQVLHEADDKRMFHKVGKSLAAAGHDVISVCASDTPLPPEVEGIRLVAIPHAPSKRGRLKSVVRLVRIGLKERADCYVAPEPESWVAALLVKLRTGARVVFDMHEHPPTEFAKFFPRPVQGFIAWTTTRVMQFLARFTDHIILTRESFRPDWGNTRTPMTVVINTNHLQPPCTQIPEAMRARYAGRPVIIHQGIFGDLRGSWQLLDAVKLLAPEFPGLKCIVLGRYVYGSEGEYRAAIHEAGLDDVFDLPGVVPFEDVPAYIAVSQVGLILFQPGLHNHTIAMPHKLFDYMREGVPVVVPDFSLEVRRIVLEADCGHLVDVTDPAAIAEGIAALLRDPERARQLGQQGRQIIETTYNWQRDEAKLLAVFDGLSER